MRKLMWFTIGFTLAVIAGVYILFSVRVYTIIALTVAGILLTVFCKKKIRRPVIAMLVGLLVGTCWLTIYDAQFLKPARQLDGKVVSATIEISDYSMPNRNGNPATGRLSYNGQSYQVCVYPSEAELLSPGDRMDGNFRLRYTASGGEKDPTYHQGKGIFLLAYAQKDTVITKAEKVPSKYFAAELRHQILLKLDKLFPDDVVGISRALLLGDRSRLSYRVDTDFSYSGIAHIIAVSGMHVSILFALLYDMLGKRKWPTALLGFPLLLLFAALAGFSPSVIRACIMQALMILAIVVDKEYDPPTALSFAVLCMLTVNPLTITAVSFQLSVGCMIGIFLVSGKLHDYLISPKRLGPAKGKTVIAKCTRWVIKSLSVTLGAMLLTIPLCAYYFGTVSIIGIVTNLATLWIISFAFYGIMLSLLLGTIWMPLGCAFAWLVAWAMRYVLLVAKVFARFPLGVVFVNNPYIIAWLVFSFVILVAFFLMKRRRPVVLCVCILFGLVVSVIFTRVEPKTDEFRVTVLDVGQGQSVLLQYDDKNFLVDCGGDSASVAADAAMSELLSQGIHRLDGVIVTHFDADHVAGVEPLLSQIPATTVYLPDAEPDDNYRNRLAEEYDEVICWIDFGEILRLENFPATIIAAPEESTGNESSLCILFEPDDCDILITGDRNIDGEEDLLKQYDIPELELLIVGHHGSASSTGLELLQETSPAIAAISVGSGNSYGHPTEETLRRLELIGCEIWRTDLSGTLTFRG